MPSTREYWSLSPGRHTDSAEVLLQNRTSFFSLLFSRIEKTGGRRFWGGAPASIPYKGNGESRCAPVFSLGKRAIVSAPRGCDASAEKFLE